MARLIRRWSGSRPYRPLGDKGLLAQTATYYTAECLPATSAFPANASIFLLYLFCPSLEFLLKLFSLPFIWYLTALYKFVQRTVALQNFHILGLLGPSRICSKKQTSRSHWQFYIVAATAENKICDSIIERKQLRKKGFFTCLTMQR